MLRFMLHRDQQVVIAALVLVVGLAWTWLLLGAGSTMSPIEMTHMAGMDGWLMTPATWSLGYAGLMFSMWWVMMVAMMLPSAAPMLLLFTRICGTDPNRGAPLSATAAFGLGYLFVWGGFSLAAASLQALLEAVRLMSPMLEVTNHLLGATIVVGAGLWQLSTLKAKCLAQCRTPLSFIMRHWRDGRLGAFQMGLHHGAYCLGCCWFLMTLLFFGGIMNLYWIIGLAAYVLLEKVLPIAPWLSRLAGAALIAWGIAIGAHAF